VWYAAPYGLQPPFTSTGEHALWLASPPNACSALGSDTPSGSIVLAYRGNCTFFDKAKFAADSGAKGLIVINNSSDSSECLYMSEEDNRTKRELAPLLGMFVASATGEQGWPLANLTPSADKAEWARGSYKLLQIPKLDPAAIVLLALAVITIIVAAAWTGMEFKQMLAQHEHAQRDSASQQESPSIPTTFDRGTALSCFVNVLPCCCHFHKAGA
jgi:signal peptide peptidase-like 2B